MADLSQFPQPRPPPPPPRAVSDCPTHKNRLQQLAQKSSLPIPAYTTVNEGLGHLPRFRATVSVNGKSYTSPNTFLHRKEAEQDAARIACEAFSEKINFEELPAVHEDVVFSKSIMNEFAVKMHLGLPTYLTRQLEVDTPSFTSSLILNNVSYPTCTGRNKKEAEQLAARAAIHALQGKIESEAVLAPILNAKARLYATQLPKNSSLVLNSVSPVVESARADGGTSTEKGKEAIHGSNDALPVVETATDDGGTSTKKARDALHGLSNALPVVEAATVDGGTTMEKATEALPDNTMITFFSPLPEFSLFPAEPRSSTIKANLPITFVPAASEQQSGEASGSSKKRRKNKKKADKRARTGGTEGSDLHPFNQVAPCSVSPTH